MRGVVPVAAAVFVAMTLAACGAMGEDEATITVTKTPTSTSGSNSSSATLPPPADENAEEQPQGAAPEAPADTGADGYQCPQSGAFVSDPSQCAVGNADAYAPQDLSTIPFADGGTCPAAICGYGHDENGNPNPSSGEIQTKGGCDAGYITDPALCGAVNEKYDTYGW